MIASIYINYNMCVLMRIECVQVHASICVCVRWWLEGGGDGEGSVVKDEIERARSSERNSLEEGIRQRKDRGAKEKRRQNELSRRR